MIRCRTCSSNAADRIYTTKPPATARINRAMRLRPTRILFLLKNLNIAPSAYSLEPDAHLVVQLLIENVHSNGILDLFKRWNGIHAAGPRLGHKNLVVVFANILVRRREELSKSDIEISRRPHPS